MHWQARPWLSRALLQGGLDPLNDAKGRTRQLSGLCPEAMVMVFDAGHCPHDEQPEQVGACNETDPGMIQSEEEKCAGCRNNGDPLIKG